MADKTKKWDENAPGLFFVDDQCIDCDACRAEAPEFFRRDDKKGFSYVYKQPVSQDEIVKAQQALEACPVEAIGRDE